MPRSRDLVRLRPEAVEGDRHSIISTYALCEDGRHDAGQAFERDLQQVLRVT